MDKKRDRSPAFPISELAGSLPSSVVHQDVDPLPVAQAVLVHLQLLDHALLKDDALWRDLFCLTGTARTLSGSKTIENAWKELTAKYKPHMFRLVDENPVRVVKPGPTTSWIEARFTFRIDEDNMGRDCAGTMRIVSETDLSWKIWTVVTILQNVDSFGDVDNLVPIVMKMPEPKDSLPHPRPASPDQDQLPTPESDSVDGDTPLLLDCVVAGAGMSGLCVAGRLKALGVHAVVLDRNKEVGDNWTDRYDSVSIHTSRDYGQMPFAHRIWGNEYPYHLSLTDMSDGYKRFVDMYGIDVWTWTNLEKAFWDDGRRVWTLEITRRGVRNHIAARHLVLALGGGGQVPKWPNLANKERFKGTLLHSVEYKSSLPWAGMRGVVVGSANSGHDIANDMLESGLSSVTMVQRSRTLVCPIEYWRRIFDQLYNERVPTDLADMLSMTSPTATLRLMAIKTITQFASEEPERFDKLEANGFKVDRDLDLYSALFERLGGHYIDVGVSKKIADGYIKMKSDAKAIGFNETGLEFDDGSTLDADVIILATGFEGNMRLAAQDIVGDAIGAKLEDWWGVDREGELRGAWKPIGHPNIWFTGGNVALARYYSRFLALQIKADLTGNPLQVYSETPE